MSTIKFDIQKFSGGNQRWTAGITVSAIEEAYKDFNNQIDQTIQTIKDNQAVYNALTQGWMGQDREDYWAKFQKHSDNVIAQIEEYRIAVGVEIASIIDQWTEFQKGLIS